MYVFFIKCINTNCHGVMFSFNNYRHPYKLSTPISTASSPLLATKSNLCPLPRFNRSLYEISSKSVQRFRPVSVRDRVTFMFIILVQI